MAAWLARNFESIILQPIPRNEDAKADKLAMIVFEGAYINFWPVYITALNFPCISQIKDGKIPENKNEAQKLIMKASHFLIIDDELYQKSFARPLLLCVTKQKGKNMLSKIHGR